MSTWRDIQVAGLRPVRKLVATFRVSDTRSEDGLRLPFPLFSVSVWETLEGSYWAQPNVAIKDACGDADWIGGGGATVDAALEDCLKAFLNNIGDREWLSEDDFFWTDGR